MSINNTFYGLSSDALADLHHAVLNDIEAAECVPGIDLSLIRQCLEHCVSVAMKNEPDEPA